jgi:hypothetical protein
MNATINQYYDGPECEYKVEFRTIRMPIQNKSFNRPHHSRRRGGPNLCNGIHRRRRKKITW